LFVFSGIWPHLKLLLLHATWFTPFRNVQRRRRTLSCLAVLGKWSLVDVLVVCVMVGVLHLEWTFTASHMQEQIQSHLPAVVALVHSVYSAEQLCSMALKYSCDHPKNVDHILQCNFCRSTINTWFDHPDSVRDVVKGISTTGGGQAKLSVVGLHGIYAFCSAVILSIVLSFIVDWYDLQCRTHAADTTTAAMVNGTTPDIEIENNSSNDVPQQQLHSDDMDDAILNQLLLVQNGEDLRSKNRHSSSSNSNHRMIDTRSMADRDFDRAIRIENERLSNQTWQMVSYVTVIIVVAATVVITMERRVNGALPTLLQETLGVVWTKQYNFIWLGYTTALAGKWDLMLTSTFVWFIIAGPIVRSILCLFANRLYEQSTMSAATIAALYRRKQNLSIWIDFIGAFCAWEVFAVAVVMVDLLMPSITSTIIMDARCTHLIPDHNTCLEVEFDIMKNTFWLVIVGGLMLLLVSHHVRTNMQQICD
jgi:hypothetical protein